MRAAIVWGVGAIAGCGVWLGACRGKPGGEAGEAVATAAAPAPVASGIGRAAEPPPAATPAVPSDVPAVLDGANLTMDSLEADGLEAKRLSCKTSGGPFAAVGVVGALAKQRTRLAACSPTAVEVRVHFAYADGKVGEVKVAGAEPPVNACVAAALAAAAPPKDGACVLTLSVGPG